MAEAFGVPCERHEVSVLVGSCAVRALHVGVCQPHGPMESRCPPISHCRAPVPVPPPTDSPRLCARCPAAPCSIFRHHEWSSCLKVRTGGAEGCGANLARGKDGSFRCSSVRCAFPFYNHTSHPCSLPLAAPGWLRQNHECLWGGMNPWGAAGMETPAARHSGARLAAWCVSHELTQLPPGIGGVGLLPLEQIVHTGVAGRVDGAVCAPVAVRPAPVRASWDSGGGRVASGGACL